MIPRPGFPLYKTLTSVYGINFKQYDLNANDHWTVDLAHLESLIDDQTAAIIVNNPSNPCGSVFSREHLLEILELAERHRKPIIADEIYDRFVFREAQLTPEVCTLPVFGAGANSVSGAGVGVKFRKPPTSKRREIAGRTRLGSGQQPPPRPYTDPSLVKCPNRRYRYNGDDGPEYGGAGDSPVALDDDEDDAYNYSTATNATADVGCQSDDDFVTITSDEEDDEDYDVEKDISCAGVARSASTGDFAFVVAKSCDEDLRPNVSFQLHNKSAQQDDLESICQPFIAMSSLTKTVPILTCGGISKTCLIPGLRLGWIIINDNQGVFAQGDLSVRNGLGRLAQRLMGPSSLVQGALADILRNVPESFYAKTMQFIYKNARICYERLSRVKGLKPHLPQGSMYLMVGFDATHFPTIDGDLAFTSKLMNEQSVLVLPGKCFDFPNYFRICLTVPTGVIEEAMSRIKEFCDKYYVTDTAMPAVEISRTKRV